MNIDKIPELVASTSMPQKWHVPPRSHGFSIRPVSDVNVVKADVKKQKVDRGIQSNFYNPLTIPVIDVNVVGKMMPLLTSQHPPTQWTQISDGQSMPPLVDSKVGPVPQGCFISYQVKSEAVINTTGPESPPPFNLFRPCNLIEHLSVAEKSLLKDVSTTLPEAIQYELDTHQQSKCPVWHTLRKNRITASVFKSVTGRKAKFEELACTITTSKNITTAAMQYGIDNEDAVANIYRQKNNVDIHPVGFVINPSACYLGCSPDRRVFDPEAEPKWGLLEIKCSTKEHLAQLPYLKFSDSGFSLKKSHQYYEQCMGQMGLTGTLWCDFYVACGEEYHQERIDFDEDFFLSMKHKLDNFYFKYMLPELVKKIQFKVIHHYLGM